MKNWKPKIMEYYWMIRSLQSTPNLRHWRWNDDGLDQSNLKIGNCFKTKAEAQKKLKEILTIPDISEVGWERIHFVC